jgi:hypothetical protein
MPSRAQNAADCGHAAYTGSSGRASAASADRSGSIAVVVNVTVPEESVSAVI